MAKNVELPYILEKRSYTITVYNPKYGDMRVCICGHPYYRHFDSYDRMKACGCKYCECGEFEEKNE